MPNAKTCPIPTMTINNRVGTSCDEHSNVSFNTRARMSKGELLVNPQSYGSYTFRQINFKDFFSCFQGLRFLQKLKIGIFNPLLNSSYFTSPNTVDHIIFLPPATTLCKVTCNCIWATEGAFQWNNKKIEIKIVHAQKCFYFNSEFYRFLHLGWWTKFPRQKDLVQDCRNHGNATIVIQIPSFCSLSASRNVPRRKKWKHLNVNKCNTHFSSLGIQL